MTAARFGYRYPLAALETLYAHRLEQARLLLAAAQRRLDDHLAHIGRLRMALDRSHGDWASTVGRAPGFDPARHAAVREALGAHQAGLDAALLHERELRADVERCRERIAQAHRRTETVERHKERSMQEFEQELIRLDQRQADAAWPVRGERS
ncbi:hypothetical protein D3C87_478010 [compost metagenome]